jgi:hypothetical protein
LHGQWKNFLKPLSECAEILALLLRKSLCHVALIFVDSGDMHKLGADSPQTFARHD